MNFTFKIFPNSLKYISCKTLIRDNRLRLMCFTIIGALFFCLSSVFGQNTTIIFNTKENSTIGIEREIDNTITSLTEEIKTDSTGNYIYSWDVNDFQSVGCYFYDGGTLFFPIKEGSHLTITYKGNNQVEITGADKAEVEYFTNSCKKGIIQPFLKSLFGLPDESNFEDISVLVEKYYAALSNTLDSLIAENAISLKFSDIAKNHFHIITTCTAVGLYRTKYLENTGTKVNGQDSIKVENLINGILEKISPMIDSGDILKYSSGSSALAVFYTNKYRHLDEKDKEELFSRKSWASYLKPVKFGYLIAPEETLYKLLSLELLDNYRKAETKGISTLFNHISEIRPQNAFLPYLKEEYDKLLISMNADHSGVKYIEDTINSLEALSKVNIFDQKILYIDIWATWCAPCIAEFKHKDEIYELLSNYKDIIPVYISVDEDSNDAAWRAKTKIFNLYGYHLRANKELITDIAQKLFEGKTGSVPQYILLDKDGNILKKRLPRPSNIDKLKEELDKHFE